MQLKTAMNRMQRTPRCWKILPGWVTRVLIGQQGRVFAPGRELECTTIALVDFMG